MQRINSSMKAIIDHNGKFLLVQEKIGEGIFWDIPGGTVEFGEEPLEALHREVFEEVGLEIAVKKTLGVYAFHSETKNVYVVCTVFLCAPKGKPIVDITKNPASEDIMNFGWFSMKDLEALKNEGLLPKVSEFLEGIKNTI